tara:strand:- start:2141 stop:3781 length:1641 start_codon:yes stop_codon:yes gene_type:complete
LRNIKILKSIYKLYPKNIKGISIVSLITGISDTLLIYFLSKIIISIDSQYSSGSFSQLLYPLLAILSIAIRYFSYNYSIFLAFDLGKRISNLFAKSIIKSDYRNLVNISEKRLLSVGLNDCNSIIFGVLLSFCTVISVSVTLLTISIYCIYLNPKAFFALIIISLFLILIARKYAKHGKLVGEQILIQQEEYINNLKSIYNNAEIANGQGIVKPLLSVFGKTTDLYRNAQSQSVLISFKTKTIGDILIPVFFLALSLFNSSNGISNLNVVTISYMLVLLRLSGPVQQMISALTYISVYSISIRNVLDTISILKRSNSSSGIINHTLAETNKLDQDSIYEMNNIKVYKDLNNDKNKELILSIDDLRISKNEFIGFSGPSGSGKSTLLRLLTGCITIDDGYFSLNPGLISIVTQKPLFTLQNFEDEIKLYSRKDFIDFNEVDRLRKRLNLSDRFSNLEELLNTQLSQVTSDLSGGQLQRLSIIRALVSGCDTLILDEPTSGQDKQNELSIIYELSNWEGTVIIVSHLQSTLCHCDRVIFLKDGKIAKI